MQNLNHSKIKSDHQSNRYSENVNITVKKKIVMDTSFSSLENFNELIIVFQKPSTKSIIHPMHPSHILPYLEHLAQQQSLKQSKLVLQEDTIFSRACINKEVAKKSAPIPFKYYNLHKASNTLLFLKKKIIPYKQLSELIS